MAVLSYTLYLTVPAFCLSAFRCGTVYHIRPFQSHLAQAQADLLTVHLPSNRGAPSLPGPVTSSHLMCLRSPSVSAPLPLSLSLFLPLRLLAFRSLELYHVLIQVVVAI